MERTYKASRNIVIDRPRFLRVRYTFTPLSENLTKVVVAVSDVTKSDAEKDRLCTQFLDSISNVLLMKSGILGGDNGNQAVN